MSNDMDNGFFEDIPFPQDKGGILRYADDRHAERSLLESVVKIPDRTYRDPREVLHAVQKTQHEPQDDDRVYLRDYIDVVGEESLEQKPRMRSADAREFRTSALESRRSLEDGRDD